MAEQQQRVLPTPGRFRAKVTDHDMGESSTGNVQVAIGFAYEDGEGVAHRIAYYGSFTEKSCQSEYGVLYALKNLGFDLQEKGFSDDAFRALGMKTKDNPLGGVLIGLEADITVEHEEYEGKTRAKIAWVNAPGGGLLKNRLEGVQEIQSAAAKVRAILGGGGGPPPSMGAQRGYQGPQSASQRPQTNRPVPSGSDLPF